MLGQLFPSQICIWYPVCHMLPHFLWWTATLNVFLALETFSYMCLKLASVWHWASWVCTVDSCLPPRIPEARCALDVDRALGQGASQALVEAGPALAVATHTRKAGHLESW